MFCFSDFLPFLFFFCGFFSLPSLRSYLSLHQCFRNSGRWEGMSDGASVWIKPAFSSDEASRGYLIGGYLVIVCLWLVLCICNSCALDGIA
ncbi:hypothetical protein B9Z19DRAFT_823965 [Tuber borchii]|uniref:Uncharacterized protein n=1 Tax=Tuber borchii TaxID=42251 RepID=A0A2T6ZVH3_TUBBO|nr:hypothetical protein B9Z19DRAFT_823965 [Tuber borchii]